MKELHGRAPRVGVTDERRLATTDEMNSSPTTEKLGFQYARLFRLAGNPATEREEASGTRFDTTGNAIFNRKTKTHAQRNSLDASTEQKMRLV